MKLQLYSISPISIERHDRLPITAFFAFFNVMSATGYQSPHLIPAVLHSTTPYLAESCLYKYPQRVSVIGIHIDLIQRLQHWDYLDLVGRD